MKYSKIIQHDIANGEGWRTTLFVSGCHFNCSGCFNLESQDFENGNIFNTLALTKVMEYVSDTKVSGLSILGGDPLCQDEDGILRLIDICHRVHDLNKTIWLWSGFTWEQVFPKVITDDFNIICAYRQELIQNVDVFIDGPFVEGLKDPSLKWRGSSNQRIIDVKKSIEQGKVVLFCE
jgi:anaerobic ribonucleoside-triphosphate reductase activating protein